MTQAFKDYEKTALAELSVRAALRLCRAVGLAIPHRVASQQDSAPFHQVQDSIPGAPG